jgi:hypothetical protein
MKTFKLHLSIGAPTYLNADRWEQDQGWFKFYRHDTTVAEFAIASVLRIDELDHSSRPTESDGNSAGT